MSTLDVSICKSYINKARNADQRGIAFDLSFRKFKQLRTAKKCFYTGEELTDETRTIDRIDASIGYTDTNVVACHCNFNQREANMTLQDIKQIVRALKKKGIKI